MVHGDLKCDNILCRIQNGNLNVVIGDLGSSFLIKEKVKTLSSSHRQLILDVPNKN